MTVSELLGLVTTERGAAHLAAAEDALAAEYGPGVAPWYPGLYLVDHLIPMCPALRRGLNGHPPRPGKGVLHPDAGDVCGWCRRTWNARNRKEEIR